MSNPYSQSLGSGYLNPAEPFCEEVVGLGLSKEGAVPGQLKQVLNVVVPKLQLHPQVKKKKKLMGIKCVIYYLFKRPSSMLPLLSSSKPLQISLAITGCSQRM